MFLCVCSRLWRCRLSGCCSLTVKVVSASPPSLCCSAASSQTSTQAQSSCFTSQNVCAARWWIQTLWCHPHLLMSPQPARPCEGSPDCIRQMDVAQTEERSRHIFSDRCCRSAAAESSLLSDKGHHTPLSDYLALLRQARLLKWMSALSGCSGIWIFTKSSRWTGDSLFLQSVLKACRVTMT